MGRLFVPFQRIGLLEIVNWDEVICDSVWMFVNRGPNNAHPSRKFNVVLDASIRRVLCHSLNHVIC
jgi:hypothetical protein